MQISIQLDKQDWHDYMAYLQKKFGKRAQGGNGRFWANVALWTVVTLIGFQLWPDDMAWHWPSAFVVFALALVFLTMLKLLTDRITRQFEPHDKGIFSGTHQFEFNEAGIRVSREGYSGQCDWRLVLDIEREQGMIMIYLDSAMAYVLPEKKLDNPDQLYQVIIDSWNIAQNKPEI